MKIRPHFVTALFALLVLLTFLAGPALHGTHAQQPPAQPVVARIRVESRQDFDRLAKTGVDLLEMRDGDDLFILTTPAQVEQLGRDGWHVFVDETQTDLLGRDGRATFRDGYRTVAEMRAFLEASAANYPDLAEFFIYGMSWKKISSGGTMGSDLFGIRLTNRQRPGPKPTFFLMAAIHARELTTSELALRFVDYLLSNYGVDADATWLLDEHLVVVVPVANPDGRALAEQNYYQRKNTNNSYGGNCSVPPTSVNQYGVDLNRNYDFKWGTINPPTTPLCSQTYPGPTAASEPETTSLANLVRALFPDQRGPNDTDPAPLDATGVFLTLHSYSNLVLWPWGWTDIPAPNAASLERIGRRFAAYNAMTPMQAAGLYLASGTTDDWSYGELGIASFTFEVGPSSGPCGGFFPSFGCLDSGTGGFFWPRNLPAFLYAARIARAPYRLAEGPTPITATAGLLMPGQVQIRAELDEQFNGNQAIAAAEYYIDIPPWNDGLAHPMTAADGSFDSPNEVAVAPLTYSGQHTIYVRAQDSAGDWGPVRAAFTPDQTCAFSLASTSRSFASGGGTGSVNVTAPAGCSWAAASNDSWITFPSGNSGTGNSSLTYAVAANTDGDPRTGTITVAGQTFTVRQGAQFNDVPASYLFYTEIGKISARNITLGCGGGNFCPDAPVTREQMAAFIIRALGDFNPPPPAQQRYLDVSPSNIFYAFIEQMAVRQITQGCGGNNYCPGQPVTREQMAAFVIRALGEFNPPMPGAQRYLDVPPSNIFYNFIDRMAVLGITQGCGGGNYCPGQQVTRGQMAAFLVRAFNL